MRVSLCVCLYVYLCGGMQATICRALQNDLPTPKRSAHLYTYTHTHSHTQILTTLTHSLTHTHGSSQNAQAKIAANYMRLQSSAAQPLSIFRSHILLAVVVSATATATVVVIIACLLLSPPERSTIVFMSLLFNCTHFRFRFGQELRSVFCPLPAWFYIPVVVLFCCLCCCCCCDDQLPSNHAPPTQSTAETKR